MTPVQAQHELIDTDGHRITRRAVQRGLRVNIVAGAFGMVWVAAAMGMATILFMEALGASGVMIGMIVTIQQLAMFMQIPAAYFAERLPSRKRFWAGCAIPHRAMWIIPALLPWALGDRHVAIAWSMLAVVAASSILLFTGSASWHSWMADFIPEQIRGRFWGLRQSITMFAYLLGVGLTGWILDRFPESGKAGSSFLGFSLVFAIAAIAGTLDIIIHLRVPEPRASFSNAAVSFWTRLSAPLKQHDFLWVTLAFGAWAFALGLLGSFSIIYLMRTFTATYSQIAAITISASIGAALSGLLWGRVMDTIGGRAFGGAMLFAVPFFGFVWFFVQDTIVHLNLPLIGELAVPQSILLLGVVNLFAGAFFHGVVLSQFSLTAALAPREGRTMAMAVHWTVVGAIAAAGPLLGGRIMDLLATNPVDFRFPTGTSFSFIHLLVLLHAIVIWVLALPFLMRVRKRTGDVSVRLLIANPLRTVGTLHNIITIGTAATGRQRAEAIRKVGAGKSALGLEELLRRLNDPLPEVRQEAALAVGRIGTPAAINALLLHLDNPESDIGPQIARSLRESKHPELVAPLLRQLLRGDSETRAESARTLGEIGDPRATESLLHLFRESEDSRLLAASSEALARLGVIAAVHDILPRMKTTGNPILARTLAIAVGDLLAGRQGFYKILMEEEQNPSAAVIKGLGRLRRALRRKLGRGGTEACHRVVQRLDQLEEAYEEQRWREAARLARELGGEMTARLSDDSPKSGFGVQRCLTRANRLAIGMWYLDYLDRQWPEEYGPPTRQDILLSIHFLVAQFANTA